MKNRYEKTNLKKKNISRTSVNAVEQLINYFHKLGACVKDIILQYNSNI